MNVRWESQTLLRVFWPDLLDFVLAAEGLLIVVVGDHWQLMVAWPGKCHFLRWYRLG